ncbi:MAG: replicative DNA helicase [bacterium]|nr:replicative DNA helicase [bacterium]
MAKISKEKLKLPPQNLEAEQSVLGSILIDKVTIVNVADLISAQDFYKPAHEIIYSCILDLYQKNQPIDLLSLTTLMRERGNLADVGGSGYLAELVNGVATAAHAVHYANIVREKKVLRDLISTSSQIAEHAFDFSGETAEFLDEIEQRVLAISQKSITKKFSHIKDELQGAYERIERLHQGDGRLRGISTGFTGLDNITSGLQNSDFIVLGARPSLGKTSLALDIARNVASKSGIPVGIFSLEMAKEQVIDRFIAAESDVPLWKLRTGRITDDIDFQMIQEALDRLSNAPIFIDDSASPNILQMRSMARRMQIEHGLGLIVVDYLQLITPRTSSDNVVSQITEISRGLKTLARELNVPIIALSQLSRMVEHRETKVPKLADLRDSGSIEQDADLVMFIYRKDRDNQDAPPEEQNMAEIIIAKHRNGPLGTVKLKFDTDRVSFRNIDSYHSTEI